MSIRQKLTNWVFRGEIAKIQARYEAAYWNLNRSYLPGFIQSAREDINTLSRQEISRRLRYFEKNSNVLGKVLTLLDVNVVGSGIMPTPVTTNKDWNTAAKKWFGDWAKVADKTGQTTLWQNQSIVYRAENVDGDHGVEMTFSDAGRPVVSLIESHRIGSGGVDVKLYIDRGYKVIDGVVIDPTNGRPLVYLVADEFDARQINTIPASRLALFFRKKRAGQYRGISRFHAAILDLHDLDDLQKFEMLAAKVASSRAEYIKSTQGSISPSDPMIGRSLQQVTPIQSPNREAYYAGILGGESKVLQPGDDVVQAKSDRPSAAISGFWDRLDNKIVQGAGVSYAALVDYKGNWGGATLRAAVQSDNRIYELDTLEQSNGWQKIWEFAVGWAMDHGELTPNPEFRNVRWHPPRRATVDIGHDTTAMLDQLKAGITTYQDIYGEMGDDFEERLDQRAKEEVFIEDLSAKYGIPRQLIASFAQERLNGQAPDAVASQPGQPGGNQP